MIFHDFQPAYLPALATAQHIRAHWPDASHPPSAEVMAAMVNAAFWTSLRREEGFVPRISLAWVGREQVEQPLILDRAIALIPASLARLAPAVERPGIHLGIAPHGESGELRVWGATRGLPAACFVVEVVAPGLIVVKQSRADDRGKFVNIAVLEGDEIRIIDQHKVMEPDCPALLKSLLGFDSQFGAADIANVLIQVAVSMRAHAHGGALLVVPTAAETWRESMARPLPYQASPSFTALTQVMNEEPAMRQRRVWQNALRQAVDFLAGLTAIDGATVITDHFEVLAFGAKIMRRIGRPPIEAVVLTEPVEGTEPQLVNPAQLGGTRHGSAAQFVQDQHDAIALVASQDGHFTVFAWAEHDGLVHAHRIESLLL